MEVSIILRFFVLAASDICRMGRNAITNRKSCGTFVARLGCIRHRRPSEGNLLYMHRLRRRAFRPPNGDARFCRKPAPDLPVEAGMMGQLREVAAH
jgi:hypothetical protein